jgi:FKBP-type peptidyl-prolyl cis-trans isomerase FklB
MNTKITTVLLLAALGWSSAPATEAPTFKDDKEKANYALGLNMGTTLKQNHLEYDAAAFDRGIRDALAGQLHLNPQEQRDAFTKYQQDRRTAWGEKNKTEGEAFLAANKTKPDIKTTASGLQYKVLTPGSGAAPKPEDTVTVKYRGTLIDGTEFDNSERSPGGTVNFVANRVIPGWTEALTNMTVGAKWQLFIPAQLAYGEAGNRNIAPNSTLLFDVELVSFQPPAPPPPPAAPLTSDVIKVPSLEEMQRGAKIETIKAEDVEKMQREKAN